MIAELIILGLAIKVILGAVKRGRQRQTARTAPRPGATGDEPGR